jgi:hypothetical protein
LAQLLARVADREGEAAELAPDQPGLVAGGCLERLADDRFDVDQLGSQPGQVHAPVVAAEVAAQLPREP